MKRFWDWIGKGFDVTMTGTRVEKTLEVGSVEGNVINMKVVDNKITTNKTITGSEFLLGGKK